MPDLRLWRAQVPWNTSAVWLSAYPELVPEVAQNPNAAWGLVFVGNTFCNATSPAFVDMSNASLAKLNGTEWGNVISC